MTTFQLADKNFRGLTSEDTISKALDLMQQHSYTHMPVVKANIFNGLIPKAELLDAEASQKKIKDFNDTLLPASVNGSAHFLQVVPIANIYKTNVIPVVNDTEEYLGCITYFDLINALGNFSGAGEYGALIILQIAGPKLNISELNAIMESDGATILHYNTSPVAATELMEVSIQINKRDVSTILATLEQYKYQVLYSSGDDVPESELTDNYFNLMNYLDI